MATSETLPSKKRKRGLSIGKKLVCSVTDETSRRGGPVLVNYPAIQGPPSITFQRYAHKRINLDKEKILDDPRTLVVGETDDIEFTSNIADSVQAANSGCRYLVAIFDRVNGTLKISSKTQSPYVLTRTVKNKKHAPLTVVNSADYQEARTALGQAFGTKKSQAFLRARAREHIDPRAMEGVMDHLQEGIDKVASNLLTKEQAQEVADMNRLIPRYDTSATEPEDIYPLHGIISEAEWKALSVCAFEGADALREKIAFLPYKSSEWIQGHMKLMVEKLSKSQNQKLRIIYYISTMFAFRKIMSFLRERQCIERQEVCQRLAGVPGVIAESLLARFSVIPRGSTSHAFTTGTELNLLSHVFALCLKVEGFSIDTSVLAHDLSMPPRRVNQIFKSLGCKYKTLGENERRRLGLPNSMSNTKFAVLEAPLTFPKAKVKRRG